MGDSEEFGAGCSQLVEHSVRDEAIKARIVHEHNKLRSKVAQGHEARGTPGPQPAAANMKKMFWDEELATIAQRWSNQCIFAHDSCRHVERFLLGQSVYFWSSTYHSGKAPTSETVDVHLAAWTKAVTAWYDEVAKFNPAQVEPFQFTSATGHYTALAWANTDRVGCGFVTFLGSDDGWYTKHFVCNYGPAGNVLRNAMYQIGDAGASCQQVDADYPALCV
ncbi:venom allergen 3-like [Periplaneta americana]|uniref:venom allergen 3-like n=1 Tax=Periplaneta americana TaxID=6978 RepID=UPI0037E7B239